MAGRSAWMAMVCLLMLAWGEATAQPQRATLATGDPAIVAAAAQIAAHAGKHRLIVLGELHGTRQIPALTAALVAHHVAQGPVTLALEVPKRLIGHQCYCVCTPVGAMLTATNTV